MDICEMIRVCQSIQDLCRHHGDLFVVNDRVGVTIAMDADVMHIGPGYIR